MADSTPPDQFTELAELAGGFIHDIKNHISTLLLNVQMLAEDFENPQTQRERRALERVTRLADECARLADLSNDFLRFARVQELKREPIALAGIVERMIDFLTPTARQRGIAIDWYPASEFPLLDLDRDLFDQALLNILLNAEQAMPEGGTITIITRLEREWACLDIIDTGCGMTPDVQAKLFRPFHTTKPNGNGLGLPTVRKVVLAHGGAIDVLSEPDRGTKVTIRLPVGQARSDFRTPHASREDLDQTH